MKKTTKTLIAILTIALLFPIAAMLTACGKKKVKLPTNAYEKVQFAFNGVEKSFKSATRTSATIGNEESDLANAVVMASMPNEQSALNIIDNLSFENKGDIIDDLEYNQPPMIQFQCLKDILARIGNSYSFGTKYYNTITGTVYADMETGLQVSESNPNKNDYKYDYTFVFSILIDIDENDLITAKITFDITLQKGQEDPIQTHWYVEMYLDYDMKNASPNYELLMLTANNEKELPYYADFGYIYEYDYVKVLNNKINEWRKFVSESSTALVIDNDHQTFESYTSDASFKYKADTCKWYKNKNLRKIKDNIQGQEAALAAAYFNLGLNSTNINDTEFVEQEGVQQEVIKSFYSDISKNFGCDIIYELVCEHESHSHNDGQTGWPNQLIMQYTSGNFPQFESRSATFTYEENQTDGYLLITVLNEQPDDWDTFIYRLGVYGFFEADGGYYRDSNGEIVVVSINGNQILITNFSQSNGGGQNSGNENANDGKDWPKALSNYIKGEFPTFDKDRNVIIGDAKEIEEDGENVLAIQVNASEDDWNNLINKLYEFGFNATENNKLFSKDGYPYIGIDFNNNILYVCENETTIRKILGIYKKVEID